MQVLNIFHVLVAIALIAFVLVQRGQGATAGAAFGSGASGTVFGARGAGNFLSRSTWVLAALFCAISLSMAVMISRMSTTPEQDLGVVGSTVSEPAAGEGGQGGEAAMHSTEPAAPVIENPATGVPGNTGAQPGAEDLPAIENSVAAPTEGAANGASDDTEGGAAGGARAEDLPVPGGDDGDPDSGSGGR